MNRILAALCLLGIAVFPSCQKELSSTEGNYSPHNIVLPDPIIAALQGNVVDENDLPATGVDITVGGKMIVTDNHGFFRIEDAQLNKNAALVTAQKSGYFKSFRTFCATAGTNHVNIKLVKKTLAGSVSGTAGGEVALSNGSKIALPSFGVVAASSNTAYSGSINVYAAYIDPTSDDIAEKIPGSFMANDKNGDRVSLESYGMLAVELESDAGEKLQLKPGTHATLTTSIPATLQNKGPGTIALWSLDETSGLWKEESIATKKGSVYVGEVTHFSFWNCDFGVDAVKIVIKLQDKSALPIVGATVKLTSNTSSSVYGITDSLGYVAGLIPSNQQLQMEVLTNCKASVYSKSIGPFTENITLNPITLSGGAFTNSYVTITGKLTNCSNNAVTNGYIVMSYDNSNRWIKVNSSGIFTTSILHCPNGNNSTVKFYGIDIAAKKEGSSPDISIKLSVTNAGTIKACDVIPTQFLNYTLDGINYSITSTSDESYVGSYQRLNSNEHVTGMIAKEGAKYFEAGLVHNSIDPGTYPITIALVIYSKSRTYSVIGYYTNGNTGVSVTFTKFGKNVGEFCEGAFSGTFLLEGKYHTITNGSFKLRRKY